MEATEQAQRGRVKSVIPERGYGFITDRDGIDRFFHISQLFGVRKENQTHPCLLYTSDAADE